MAAGDQKSASGRRSPARTGRDEASPAGPVLPRRDYTIDPDTVPGERLAVATAQVRRDGVTVQPGETLRIDFRAYAELTEIGAIEPGAWKYLPEADASASVVPAAGESIPQT